MRLDDLSAGHWQWEQVARFTVPGDPQSWRAPKVALRAGRLGRRWIHHYKEAPETQWKRKVAVMANVALLPMTGKGPVRLTTRFFFAPPAHLLQRKRPLPHWKDTKPDVDRLATLVMDALKEIAYPDDCRVAALVSEKRFTGDGDPRVEIVIERLSE
jgi:Holliday junction resolvase RusA-like endonuclease